MAKGLIWSKIAQQDRKMIFDFWNEQNQSKLYSRKLNNLLKEGVNILKDFPEIGRSSNRKNIRIILIRDYWIIYKVTPTQIQILRIWDIRRNPIDFKHLIDQIE